MEKQLLSLLDWDLRIRGGPLLRARLLPGPDPRRHFGQLDQHNRGDLGAGGACRRRWQLDEIVGSRPRRSKPAARASASLEIWPKVSARSVCGEYRRQPVNHGVMFQLTYSIRVQKSRPLGLDARQSVLGRHKVTGGLEGLAEGKTKRVLAGHEAYLSQKATVGPFQDNRTGWQSGAVQAESHLYGRQV